MAKTIMKNDWWNKTIANSIKYSAIGSLISVGIQALDFVIGLFRPNNQKSSTKQTNTNYSQTTRRNNFIDDRMYIRISKYPSSSYIGYGAI